MVITNSIEPSCALQTVANVLSVDQTATSKVIENMSSERGVHVKLLLEIFHFHALQCSL